MGIISALIELFFDLMNECISQCISWLNMDSTSFNPAMQSFAEGLGDGFRSIGTVLLVLFFFIGLCEAGGSMVEMNRPEVIIRHLFRFVICNSILQHSSALLAKISEIAGSLIQRGINSAYTITGAAPGMTMSQSVKDSLNEVGFSWLGIGPDVLLIFVFSIIFLIICIVILITIYVTIITRFFYLYMYTAIAPIALSTFGSRSTSDVGKHFLKSYCGVLLQGLILVIALLLFTFVSNSISIDFAGVGGDIGIIIGYYIEILVSFIVLLILIRGADTFISKMMGI